MLKQFFERLEHDLNAPVEVRGFGSGWFAGFFGLLFAISGFGMVVALRYPDWFAMPELQVVKDWSGFRGAVHFILLASYALALLSLLLRPRKALGGTALVIAIAAALLGGSNVQPSETQSWGIFFGLDFFIVNLLATGFMFAPIERFWPHRAGQRLFRIEWREDLFYFLVSTMMVQLFAFLALAPQADRQCPDQRLGPVPRLGRGAALGGAVRRCGRSCPTCSSTGITACSTASLSSGASTRCTIRPRRWTGWRARGCISSRSCCCAR